MQEEKRVCQNCKKEFAIELEDFEFYEKISDKNSEVKVPAPTWCPDCRAKRRMSFYNIKTLYKRKCDKCGESTLSIYNENTEFPIYCQKCWWADDWDALKYGKEYDFEKPFLKQFKELMAEVPRPALETDYLRMVNSPYVNACGALKDCYLVFLGGTSEKCLYAVSVGDIKDSVDCTNVTLAENSYDIFNSARIYNSRCLVNCKDCLNVYFSKDLKNCSDCFGCVNLSNKKYQIFNKQYSKEEYFAKIKKIDLGSYEQVRAIQEKTVELFKKVPVKYLVGFNNNNVSGNYIWNSKDVIKSYGINNGENIKYSQMLELGPTKDCYDYTNWGDGATNIYETIHAGEHVNNLRFTNGAWVSYEIEYSDNALHSNNLFGCVSLNKKSYCILNKQYTKEEYFEMVEKIKKQMNEMPYVDKQGREYKYGEFFPLELSPFAYNETIAQEYFPLTKEEVKKQGYKWKEPEERNYQTTIEAKDLPDHIDDVDDSILKEVIGCATMEEESAPGGSAFQSQAERTGCTTAFKIIPQELEFYKKHNIPLPRYCPNCRHHQRLKNRNPLKLYKRTCDKEGCNTEFETTYAPDRPEIVYCEKCYQNEVA